jgi:hypothetical protein
MAYRIYTRRNFADTMRDPDEIEINDLGYRHNLKDAKKVANDYIKKRFLNENTKLTKIKDGKYSATDFCSYGATIIIEPIAIY